MLALLGLGIAFGGLRSGGESPGAQARTVVAEFFQALNARQFAKACGLLSERFYREHGVLDRGSCARGLSVGMAGPVHFEILSVRTEGRRRVVTALADGARGEVVLVKERGRFKVRALRSP